MIPGLLGTLSGGFQVTGISGLLVWLDGSVLTGNDDDPIATWSDMSGIGNHATQTTAENRPLLALAEINGLNAVYFAEPRFFSLPASFLTGTAFTGFVVAKHSTNPPTSKGPMLSGFGTSGNEPATPYIDGTFYDDFCSTTRQTAAGNAEPVNVAFCYTIASAESLWECWVNGISLFATGTNTVAAPVSQTIGRSTSYYMTGHIAEILVWGNQLSSSNRQSVEKYLGDKWNLTIDQSPVNTVAPEITAAGWTVGQVASCSTGTWTNSPTSYTYQWQKKPDADWLDITGATSSSYTIQAGVVEIRCQVVASNSFATSSAATSNDETIA